MFDLSAYSNLILYILIAGIFILIIWIYALHKKISNFTKGASGKNLEDIINKLIERSHNFESKSKDFENSINYINKTLSNSMRSFGIVRYNAFGESGGGQSFSIAVCDESGKGFIISSLCGRNKNSLYVKELSDFKADKEITPEENKALEIATNKLLK